jgi:hypothetical protein
VLANSDVPIATVLVALAYVRRALPHLHIALEAWACERVFLGALVCAAKYANDSTLRNVHWAACTQVFSPADVGRVEREFLDVLAFQLGVSEAELLPLCADLHPLVHPTKSVRHRAAARPATPLEESILAAPAPASSPAAISPSSSDEEHTCPELAHDSDSDSDVTLASPSSSPLLTPPSAAAAAPAPVYPPGLGFPLAKVPSTAGPERAKAERKRPSPLARLKSHFHHHHHQAAPTSAHSSATPSPEPAHRTKRIVPRPSLTWL